VHDYSKTISQDIYLYILQVKSNCVASVYKISMVASLTHVKDLHPMNSNCVLSHFCAQAIFTTQTTHPSIKFSQNIAEFAV
jgi:hypothetical protein